MAEEKKEVASSEKEVSDLKPEETPTEKETEFKIPKEYEGKSQEELVKQLQEKEKLIGKQGQELGERVKSLEDDVERYRRDEEDRQRMYEMHSQQPQNLGYDPYGRPIYPPSAQPEPKEPEPFDYERAGSEVRRIYADERQKEQQRAQVTSQRQSVEEGKYAYQQGRKAAFQEDTDLYKGIEREVEQRVYQTYAPYANMGISVKEFVGNPSIWKKVAQNIRLDREEYDYLVPKKGSPMKAVQTETPTSAKPTTSGIPGQYDLDTSDPDLQAFKAAVKEHGVAKSPEEVKEIIKKEQERLFKGERW